MTKRRTAHKAALKRLGLTEEDCTRICSAVPTDTLAGARELYWALPYILEAAKK